ncbi:alpha/beta fold hydrolase (plasmid) [Pseudomonas silvicola]|nr:alpha/beta fold hydrolase [Pseudomonas silvicola]
MHADHRLKPVQPKGRAVLIAAGGGYTRIEMGKEAWPAAAWLAAQGYTAYVLSYRLPQEGWKDGALVSLQDAQRALRIVRHRENNVSVLGFSAGGHLLGMAANRAVFMLSGASDALDNLPATVDRAADLSLSLERRLTHTSTHKVLVRKRRRITQRGYRGRFNPTLIRNHRRFFLDFRPKTILFPIAQWHDHGCRV